MMPMPGQMPPEDLQRMLEEQTRQQEINEWYGRALAKLEVEHRQRMVKWAAIMCTCLDSKREAPCPVHAGVMVTADGRVL